MNVYGYVGNDGVNGGDLLGMAAWYEYIPLVSTIVQAWELHVSGDAPGTLVEHYAKARVTYNECCTYPYHIAERMCRDRINELSLELSADVVSASLVSSAASYGAAVLTYIAPPIGLTTTVVLACDSWVSVGFKYEYSRRVHNASQEAVEIFCNCAAVLKLQPLFESLHRTFPLIFSRQDP